MATAAAIYRVVHLSVIRELNIPRLQVSALEGHEEGVVSTAATILASENPVVVLKILGAHDKTPCRAQASP